MRARSGSGVRLDYYQRLVYKTILKYQVRNDRFYCITAPQPLVNSLILELIHFLLTDSAYFDSFHSSYKYPNFYFILYFLIFF